MADDTLTFESGTDAWAIADKPGVNRSGGDAVRLWSGERKGLVQIPVTGIRGKTVTGAYLYGRARGDAAAQTLTVQMGDHGKNASKVTWDNFPNAVVGVSQTLTIAALDGGSTIAIPVDEIMQRVADGAPGPFFILTTDASTANTSNWWSFTSGHVSWKLVVTVSDAPEKPTNCRPNDGSVGSGAPILAWAAGIKTWTQIQVQVDPDADWDTPGFDTGTVVSSDAQYDLSADGDFTALASGDSTQWRVRVSDGTQWSPWSDAASFTYTPKHTNTFDSPTGGVIGDPTPTVLAHITGDTLRQYQILVARGTDRSDLVYDSGHQPPDSGGVVARDIPWKDPDTKRRIISGDDTDWQIGLRTWGAVQRAEAVGDPTYVETWVTVTFDDDVNEAPADYAVAPVTAGSPQLVHTWTRSEAADKWLIMTSTGQIIHTLTADDVTVDAGTYTFTDSAELQPYRSTTLTVRAVDAGSRSVASNAVTITPEPEGFWIIPDDTLAELGVPAICLRGDGVGSFTKRDRRATSQPLNVATDVDFIYGYEGVSFQGFQGLIESGDTADVLATLDQLEIVRTTPYARPRLIWATQSIRAQIKNMAPLPTSDMVSDRLQHQVTFDAIQDGD